MDGFIYGFDPKKPRFLELIHYPKQDDWSQELRVGEPIFPTKDDPNQRVPLPVRMYTVARIGMSVPRHWILSDEEDADTANHSWQIRSGLAMYEDPETGELLTSLLDAGLRSLNLLIRAYRVVTSDVEVIPIEGIGKMPTFLMYTLCGTSANQGIWRLA